MFEQFIEKSFYQSSLTLIEQAKIICQEYAAQGYRLTLRQLYYQMVRRIMIPNNIKSYKRLGSVISDARKAGLFDWSSIEDRGRWLHQYETFNTPGEFMKSVTERYLEDLWIGQQTYCEVWVEKDALAGVVARSCDEWRVPYFPCKGYGSDSELYAAGKRLANIMNYTFDRRDVVILHLGDHDPSGIDMTRDNRERLEMFSGCTIDLRRIALNMNQVEEYNPPPNFAKETDSRFADYHDKFGEDCWELDALEPSVINQLIEDELMTFLDLEDFEARKEVETENRELLVKAAENWPDVVKYLNRPPIDRNRMSFDNGTD